MNVSVAPTPDKEPAGTPSAPLLLVCTASAAYFVLVLLKTLRLASNTGVARPRGYAVGWVFRTAAELGLVPNALGARLNRLSEAPTDLGWLPDFAGIPIAMSAYGLSAAALVAVGFAVVAWVIDRAIGAAPRAQTRWAAYAVAGIGVVGALEITSLLYWEFVVGNGITLAPKTAAVVSLAIGAGAFLAVASLVWARSRRRRSKGATIALRRGGALGSSVAALTALTLGFLTWAGENTDLFVQRTNQALNEDGQSQAGIILISIDTLRADHVGTYGYARATTPTLDRLADEGVVFTNAMAVSSWTLPTHTTMLTGLPPAGHGVVSQTGQRLASETVTLTERLRVAGYDTAAFVVQGYMDAEWGHVQGFKVYDDHSGTRDCELNYSKCITGPNVVEQVSVYFHERHRRKATDPYFVLIHLMDVHNDYMPPPPYDTMFNPNYAGGKTAAQLAENFGTQRRPAENDLEQLIALYDGEIRFTDDLLGRLRDDLESINVFDQSLVIVTSDHGEELYEHGLWDHSVTLYEEVLQVPLIIRHPSSVPAGTRVTDLCGHMDIPATIAAAAGIEPLGLPDEFTGRDLRNTATVATEIPRFADLNGTTAAVRWGEHKFIRDLTGHKPDELYNLADDPHELRNLSTSQSQTSATGAKLITDWRAFWDISGVAAAELEMTPEQRERLRSLGYID